MCAFYFSTVAPNDWTSPRSDALWRDGAKTLFDPCPAGWRVPHGETGEANPWYAFTADNSIWNGTGIGPAGGRTWTAPFVFGGSVWYPAPGYRLHTTGSSKVAGDSFFTWYSGTNGTESKDSGFYYAQFYQIADDPRAYGFSVRCIRD